MGLFDDLEPKGQQTTGTEGGSGLLNELEPKKSGLVRRGLGDTGITLLKGAIAVPSPAITGKEKYCPWKARFFPNKSLQTLPATKIAPGNVAGWMSANGTTSRAAEDAPSLSAYMPARCLVLQRYSHQPPRNQNQPGHPTFPR